MGMPSVLRRGLRELDRTLAWALWLTILGGAVAGLVSNGWSLTEAPADVILMVLSAFFAVAALRVLVRAVAEPERRPARLVFLAALVLWALGSATLHSDGPVSGKSFPGPAEYYFFPSYLAFIAFFLVDAKRTRSGLKSWLETIVLSGALVCLAAAILATPLGELLPVHGVGLLLAFFYPLLDFGLLVLLTAQLLQGSRGRGRDTLYLLLGAALLVALDLHYAWQIAAGHYFATFFTDVLYGVAFALLATGACLDRSLPRSTARQDGSRSVLLLVASGAALLTLVFRPTGDDAWLVTVPAALTLAASGARLTVALREARGAAEARELSRTDELTGLLNRRALVEDLGELIPDDKPLALLLLDLDGFKEVNDTLGHSVGDQLLVEIGRRLLLAAPSGTLTARIGGDEFALVLRQSEPLALLEVSRRIRHAVSQPVEVAGIDLSVGASLGITGRPDIGHDAVEMMRRADVAMYQAKNGRLGQCFYEATHDGFSRDRLQQVELLRHGISAGQLRLWYQPLVDAATQEVVSVEALVRWEHPTLGLLQPVAFLPEARRAGLMPELSAAVLDLVIADATRWAREGRTFTVSLNCAPPELLGGWFVPRLLQELTRAELPPRRLLVEVTEDSFVTDPDRARETLQQLQDHDVLVAIDDYGTGFSSLAYLRDLPISTLKLDRTFVRGLDHTSGRIIVESTLHLAHALGLTLVAEGVENAATAASLVAMGVDVLQGYHISRPMPVSEVGRWVDAWQLALRSDSRPGL